MSLVLHSVSLVFHLVDAPGNVDDCVTVPALERCDKSQTEESYKFITDLRDAPKQYSLLAAPGPWPLYYRSVEDKVCFEYRRYNTKSHYEPF